MGCEKHPVESEIRFLHGQVEPFIRLPLTRWEWLTGRDGVLAVVLALIFAVVFGVIVGLILK